MSSLEHGFLLPSQSSTVLFEHDTDAGSSSAVPALLIKSTPLSVRLRVGYLASVLMFYVCRHALKQDSLSLPAHLICMWLLEGAALKQDCMLHV